uniref:Uncharacterized protein n=1 Tax=Oryza sativa subsp. japonica TaxID=39947 RepID=Q6UU46_ORYSJ|nr:hypothetical protein OSJNBa0079E14.18 [Oryza sativa Japonica Group]
MVTAGDHRRGGAAPEREEGRGKANGGLRLTPGQRRRRERRPEWREAAARFGMTMTKLVFTLPSSFFFGVVAPLDLAKTDYSVPGPALHGVQDFHWLLHIGQVFANFNLL